MRIVEVAENVVLEGGRVATVYAKTQIRTRQIAGYAGISVRLAKSVVVGFA